MSSTPFYVRNGLIAAPGTRTIISSGNTSQRSSAPQPGEIRYNTELGSFEFWFDANTQWANPSSGVPQNLSLQSLTTSNGISVGSTFAIGNGVFANSSALQIGTTWLTSSNLTLGSLTVNSLGIGFGNSTVSTFANATAVTVGNSTFAVQCNTSGVFIGNSTLLASVNSSIFTGRAYAANNSDNLGGLPPSSWANVSSLSAYQTTAGLSAAVAGLSSNNATYLGGTSYSNYWTKSNLTALSQLSNNTGYITSASIPTNISAFNNNVGYITGLSSGSNYSVNVMYANEFYCYGTIYAQGDLYVSYSDIRLKDIEGPVENVLDKIESLRVIYYHQNQHARDMGQQSDSRRRIGLIAQEVECVFPEVVGPAAFDLDELGQSKSGMDFKTIQYDRLLAVAFQAIKELRREVRELRDSR